MLVPMDEGSGKCRGVLQRLMKMCPLCGALNVASQRRCARCGWGGEFDTKAENLRRAVSSLFPVEEGGEDSEGVIRCVGLMEEGEGEEKGFGKE